MSIEEPEQHLTEVFGRHFEKEAEVLNLLIDLEIRFREYYQFYQCEVETQKIITERLWTLTQRYLILISSAPGCRYPQVYSLSAEEAIINEYEEKLEVLRASNNSMKNDILELNKYCKTFFKTYNELNMSMETPFICGDEHHRSITSHKNMVTDIFHYLYSAVLKMKCYMHQLDPISLESVEDYRELLKKETTYEEFKEYLMDTFVYCKCLHPIQNCPIIKHKCAHLRVENLKYVAR